MLVVNIELWPYGIESKKRQIGQIYIVNDLSGNKIYGNYKVEIMHPNGITQGVWKSGEVKRHERVLSPYHLLHRALDNVLFPTQE